MAILCRVLWADLVSEEFHGVGEGRVLALHTEHNGLHQKNDGGPSAQVEGKNDEARTFGIEGDTDKGTSSNTQNQSGNDHVVVDPMNGNSHHVTNIISGDGNPADVVIFLLILLCLAPSDVVCKGISVEGHPCKNALDTCPHEAPPVEEGHGGGSAQPTVFNGGLFGAQKKTPGETKEGRAKSCMMPAFQDC